MMSGERGTGDLVRPEDINDGVKSYLGDISWAAPVIDTH